MSDKHRNRYVAFKVTYVILFGMLKVTYPSAACPISPVQTEGGPRQKQELAEGDSGNFAAFE